MNICPNCLLENTFSTPFCLGCGEDLPLEPQRANASHAYTPLESADEGICDICAVKLIAEEKHLVSPREMRIIAGNGYGRYVNIWGNIPPAARESKFYQMALDDDTDWALCSSCYEKTRDYSVDKDDGSSREMHGLEVTPIMNDADDFPALLKDLRSKANADLSPQETRALLAMLDYGESICQLFAKGTLRDEQGKWEPPLSRSECSDLILFVMGLVKVGRGGAPIIMEMAISPESRKYALGFHAALRIIAEDDGKLVFVSPDEKSTSAARQYWRESLGLGELPLDRCTFLTWEAAAELPLEGAAVVGDAIMSTASQAARRDAIRQCIARVKGKKGIKHFVLLVTTGDDWKFISTTVSGSARAQTPRPAPEVNSGVHPGSQSDPNRKRSWGWLVFLLIAAVLVAGIVFWLGIEPSGN
jgi:hypothetical protein